MNAFWNLIDWFLPSIRLSDELDDPEALSDSHFSSAYNGTPSSYPPPRFRSQQQQQLQAVDRARGVEWQRERDKERDRERERERERERQREEEREKERQRIQGLERDNALLSQKIAQLENELRSTTQSAALNFLDGPAMPPQAALSFPSSPPSEPATLRNTYESLLTSYSVTQRALHDRTEEVTSLKSFLSKTDEWSGAQVLQALRDLNAEIVQLAASVAEEFASSLDRRMDFTRQSDRELILSALGPVLTNLLATRDHTSDPTLVQFAIQAWEVVCIGKVLDGFCFGLPSEVDQALSKIFDHMHHTEPQPTTSRWRALTYSHACALLSSSATSPFHAIADTNLRGLLSILAISGCTDPKGIHRDPLRERFGQSLARIGERAERIALAIKEGVMSASFDVLWVGTGKQRDKTASGPGQRTFEPSVMDNVYAGHGVEKGNVLCTVEFGLICVKRITGTTAYANGTTANGMANGHANGHMNGHAHSSIHGPTTNGFPKAHGPDAVLSRSLLLKPKVLLESVSEML